MKQVAWRARWLLKVSFDEIACRKLQLLTVCKTGRAASAFQATQWRSQLPNHKRITTSYVTETDAPALPQTHARPPPSNKRCAGFWWHITGRKRNRRGKGNQGLFRSLSPCFKNVNPEVPPFPGRCGLLAVGVVATIRWKKISISSQGWYVTSSLTNQFKALFRHSALLHTHLLPRRMFRSL